MDQRYLEYILVLAETGNMTRAAKKLYISQPTLSPVFSKTGGRNRITAVSAKRRDI